MTLFSLRILELGGDATMVGIGWAVTALCEAPLMIVFPRLARRAPIERLIVIGTVLFVVRSVAWSLVVEPEAVIALTVLGSAGYALVLVGTASFVARVAPAHLSATAQALFGFTTFSIGSIAGAVLAGQIAAAAGLGAVVPVTSVGSAMAPCWCGRRSAGDARCWIRAGCLARVHRRPIQRSDPTAPADDDRPASARLGRPAANQRRGPSGPPSGRDRRAAREPERPRRDSPYGTRSLSISRTPSIRAASDSSARPATTSSSSSVSGSATDT